MANHTAHDGDFILWDGCPRCEALSKTLYDLSDHSLQELAILAVVDSPLFGTTRIMSLNESRAVTHLRLMHRVIMRSKIRELV